MLYVVLNRAMRFAAFAAVLATTAVIIAQNPPAQPTLEGYAILPADTFAEGPQTGTQIDPTSNLNGRTIPFDNHPVQGISAIIPADTAGHYFVLSDNGYGAKNNSGDYLLRFYEVMPDFATGTVTVIGFTQLSDPNKLVPFPIVNDDTEDRLLTGADFDLESFRRAPDGTFWIGEEFGPYLLQFSADGVLLQAPIPTPYPDVLAPFAKGLEFVQSPQHPDFVGLADNDARRAAANLGGSRGFEGMAINPDGTMLYTLLEGPLATDNTPRLLIQEFSLADNAYTGRYFFYIMSERNHAIGEMTAINENEYLIIERDGGEGEGALFKRIYKVDFSTADAGGVLRKTLLVDLLNIADPNGLTKATEGVVGYGDIFKFPFVTIEAVYPIDADTLLVTNDNNYPFSSGRRPGSPDDNEFILITLPEALKLAQ